MSLHLISVIIWSFLGSLTFSFTGVWSLHFVAMLACQLDLPIGINVGLTVLSALLAVLFSFSALSSELIYESYNRRRRRRKRSSRKRSPSALSMSGTTVANEPNEWSVPLLGDSEYTRPRLATRTSSAKSANGHVLSEYEDVGIQSLLGTTMINFDDSEPASPSSRPLLAERLQSFTRSHDLSNAEVEDEERAESLLPDYAESTASQSESLNRTFSASDLSTSRRSSSVLGGSSGGMSSLMNIVYHRSTTGATKNVFVAASQALHAGFTLSNALKAFIWSLSITSMHYVGILALIIPGGYFILDPLFVIISALISWLVCIIGIILMTFMESNLAQQIFFSIVGTSGVAAMHFTGKSPAKTVSDRADN